MEKEFENYLLDKNKTIGTINTYLINIRCYKRWLKDTTGSEFKKLYRENIQDYISYLRNIKRNKQGLPLKSQSINTHISSLIKYNKFLVDTNRQTDMVVSDNDCLKVQKTGINPCKVSQEEIQKFRQDILEAESRSLTNWETKRNFCIVTLLQYCGIRISECIAIKLDDISIDSGELIIRNGKGGKQRILYLNDRCISAIKGYIEVRPETKNEYLFITRESINKNKPINRVSVNMIFSNTITPHQERHAWATHGLESGTYSINEVAYLAGHKSLTTTQIYLNPDVVKMKEKANLQ